MAFSPLPEQETAAPGNGRVTDDADSPPSPRRRGRPKGLGKVPGSGRRKNTPNIDIDALVAKGEEFARDVLAGKLIEETGPTGKTIMRRASIEQRIRLTMHLLDKRHADRKATELTGKDGQPLHAATGPVFVMTRADWGACGGNGDDSEWEAYNLKMRQLAADQGRELRWLGFGDGSPGAEQNAPPEALRPEGSSDTTIAHSFDVLPPAPAPRPSADVVEIGTYEDLPGGWRIILRQVEAGTGRQKWACFDAADHLHSMHWGREAAREWVAGQTTPKTSLDSKLL